MLCSYACYEYTLCLGAMCVCRLCITVCNVYVRLRVCLYVCVYVCMRVQYMCMVCLYVGFVSMRALYVLFCMYVLNACMLLYDM